MPQPRAERCGVAPGQRHPLPFELVEEPPPARHQLGAEAEDSHLLGGSRTGGEIEEVPALALGLGVPLARSASPSRCAR